MLTSCYSCNSWPSSAECGALQMTPCSNCSAPKMLFFRFVIVRIELIVCTMSPILWFLISSATSTWVGPSNDANLLPTATSNMIAGYYEDTIFLLGGDDSGNTVAIYDINNDTITASDTAAIPKNVNGINVFSQIGSTLYIFDYFDSHMILYDMSVYGSSEPLSYDYNIIETTSDWHIPDHLDASSCITSYTNNLIVLGGVRVTTDSLITGSTNVSIYNMDTQQWSTGTEMYGSYFYNGACIVEEESGFLYTFDGDYVERIQVNNVISNTGLDCFGCLCVGMRSEITMYTHFTVYCVCRRLLELTRSASV